jgi:DnaJ-class molecular chaperone
MSDDPYKILGVKKDASQDDIRKAYRKLAKELHPDLKPGDKKAEERFKKVAAAYGIVGDAEKRARFDKGEIDATGAERPEQRFYREYAEAPGGRRYRSRAGFEDLADVSDLFSDLFRGGGPGGPGGGPGGGAGGREGATMWARGRDVLYRLEVDFVDAANGAKRRIAMPDGVTLDVTVPAGTQSGAILRLKGKGGPGLGGGPAGNALVEIAVRPHTVFRRDGDDIVVELPITLDEAVLGAKVAVPTLTGRVTVTVPKGSSGGDVLRLKGKGVQPAKGPAGNQRVVLKIVLPETVDAELATFMDDWRKKHPYDPRTKFGRAS